MSNTIETFRNYPGSNEIRYAAIISDLDFIPRTGIDHYPTSDGRLMVVNFAHKFYASENQAIKAAEKVITKYSSTN